MERRGQPIGFMIKQINNVYEKDLNERLKTIGITASQCAVLDYLFHTSSINGQDKLVACRHQQRQRGYNHLRRNEKVERRCLEEL